MSNVQTNLAELVPPTNLAEFVVYRASHSTDYEVFVFSVPIGPILALYEQGKPISKEIFDGIKTYKFEDPDDLTCREKLHTWFKKLGLTDPEKAVNKCRAWRLVHIVVPGDYYPPKFQGYPVQESPWNRTATPIKREARKKFDPFDPLAYLLDETTFSGE